MQNSSFGDDIIRKIKARLAELRLETLRAKVKHNLSKAFQGIALGYCRWCGKTQSRQGVKCYYCGEHNSVVVKPTTKSATRVPRGYKPGTPDWQAEYDMLLPDGITCTDCVHTVRCCSMFGQKATDTKCQFYPSKFQLKNTK